MDPEPTQAPTKKQTGVLFHRTKPPRLFEAGEEVPKGWEATPDIFEALDMNKDELAAYAELRGHPVDKRKSVENMVRDLFEAMGTYE